MKKVSRLHRITGVVLGAALAAIMVTAMGCGDEKKDAAPEGAARKFTLALEAGPETLDPALAVDPAALNISRYLFEGLVRYNPETAEVEPAVAESWELSDDATKITFHLREGVKFSNGEEVTADDFVNSWTRALDPQTESWTAMDLLGTVQGAEEVANGKEKKLKGVKATDDHTLEVTLIEPFAEFVTGLGHPVTAPVPEKEGDSSAFGEQPVGNGPYKLREWNRDGLVLEKNPDYYGEPGKSEEISVKFISQADKAIAALKAGEVDAVRSIPADELDELREEKDVTIYESTGTTVRYLNFDLKYALGDSPFETNLKLRQAMAYAIDPEAIARDALAGTWEAADGMVPPSVPGYEEGAAPWRYDAAKARALLAEAGYPAGTPAPAVTLEYYSGNPVSKAVAEALQVQMQQAGFTVNLQGEASEDEFLLNVAIGSSLYSQLSQKAFSPSIDAFLYTLFSTEGINWGTNSSRYSNPEVDRLLAEASGELDASDRYDKYNEVQKKVLADVPVIPLLWEKNIAAHSSRVNGFVITPLGDVDLAAVSVKE